MPGSSQSPSLQVLQAAQKLCGDAQRAAFWYSNEKLSVFDNKTAEELVSDGRIEDVLRYVDSTSVGPLG